MNTPKTADGVAVRVNQRLHALSFYPTSERDRSLVQVFTGKVVERIEDGSVTLQHRMRFLIAPLEHCYSSRLAALLAARDRAAGEVARLDREIEAEQAGSEP